MIAALLLALVLAHPAPAPTATTCPVDAPHEYSNSYMIWAKNRRHKGIDIYAEKGAPVVAPEDGYLVFGSGRKGGLTAYFYARGIRYYMAHLDSQFMRIEFDTGWGGVAYLKAGDLIGGVGDSGNARGTSPHLHLEIKMNGRRVNPYPMLEMLCSQS